MLLISQTMDCALTGRTPELSRFEKDLRPVVVWNVNNQCNMTCAHCYASAVRRRTESRDLGTEESKQIIDRLADWGVRSVIFSGGEPMLREDLFTLLEHAVSRGIVPELATNGVRITKERAIRFRETGVTMVEVGLDGKPETNDAYRGIHGGFSRALDGLRYLREAGLGTSIRMTVHQKNRADLFWLLDLAVQEEFARFHLSHLLYSGRADAASDDHLHPDDSRTMMNQIFDRTRDLLKKGASTQVVSSGNEADGPALLLWAREKIGVDAARRVMEILRLRGGNGAGERVWNIDHRGEVYADQFFRSMTAGNILKDSPDMIYKSRLFRQLRDRENRLKGRCAECLHLPLCRGSNRERALFAERDLWASDPACHLTDAMIVQDPLEPVHSRRRALAAAR
jgi:radical SAM protein with 4Fe4S-binding SPASM domain